MPRETDLYQPVKALLETQGYSVKGEVRNCDIVAVRGEEKPVIVELKRSFGLELVLQGINRLTMSDAVYLAIGTWPRRLREVKKLCRRLGLGLMIVADPRVEILLDPLPYKPRLNARRTTRLLREHAHRVGDPTKGGSTRVPVMTAYRQQALRCAALLAAQGPTHLKVLRTTGDVPNAASILQDDVYGWFERIERGTYAVTPLGREALQKFGWATA